MKELKDYWVFEGNGWSVSLTMRRFRGTEYAVVIGAVLNEEKPYLIVKVTTEEGYLIEKLEKIYKVLLDYTVPNYWWKRWWFKCPCRWNRCWVLYLQGNGVFASRKTLDLVYQQQQWWKNQRDDLTIIKNIWKAEKLLPTIKYTHWRWQPTRKFKRYWELSKWKNWMRADRFMQECIWKHSKPIYLVVEEE